MRARLIAPATIPHRRELNPRPLTQQQRLDVLRRLALDDTIHPTARVSTLLMVLFAQPLLRVLRLTVDEPNHGLSAVRAAVRRLQDAGYLELWTESRGHAQGVVRRHKVRL